MLMGITSHYEKRRPYYPLGLSGELKICFSLGETEAEQVISRMRGIQANVISSLPIPREAFHYDNLDVLISCPIELRWVGEEKINLVVKMQDVEEWSEDNDRR
jgi:hypothetical protein